LPFKEPSNEIDRIRHRELDADADRAGSGAMLPGRSCGGRAAGAHAQGAVQLINRERAVVVDVREPEEFATGHIVGAATSR
jgi:hypothetical protein